MAHQLSCPLTLVPLINSYYHQCTSMAESFSDTVRGSINSSYRQLDLSQIAIITPLTNFLSPGADAAAHLCKAD